MRRYETLARRRRDALDRQCWYSESNGVSCGVSPEVSRSNPKRDEKSKVKYKKSKILEFKFIYIGTAANGWVSWSRALSSSLVCFDSNAILSLLDHLWSRFKRSRVPLHRWVSFVRSETAAVQFVSMLQHSMPTFFARGQEKINCK